MSTTPKYFTNISLTENSLCWLIEKKKNHGKVYSLIVVNVFGTGLIVGAGLTDTGIRSLLAIVRLITGCAVTPFNIVIKPFTRKSYLNDWGWTMAANHLAHAIKNFLNTFFIAGGNLFLGPEKVHKAFFKEVIEHRERLLLEEKNRVLDQQNPPKGGKTGGPPPPPPGPPPAPVSRPTINITNAANTSNIKVPVFTKDRLETLKLNLKTPKPKETDEDRNRKDIQEAIARMTGKDQAALSASASLEACDSWSD